MLRNEKNLRYSNCSGIHIFIWMFNTPVSFKNGKIKCIMTIIFVLSVGKLLDVTDFVPNAEKN